MSKSQIVTQRQQKPAHSERNSDSLSNASEGERLAESVTIVHCSNSPMQRTESKGLSKIGLQSRQPSSRASFGYTPQKLLSSKIPVERELTTLSINQSLESDVRKSRLAGFSQMTDLPRKSIPSNHESSPEQQRKSVSALKLRSPEKLISIDDVAEFDESNLVDDDIAEFNKEKKPYEKQPSPEAAVQKQDAAAFTFSVADEYNPLSGEDPPEETVPVSLPQIEEELPVEEDEEVAVYN